MTEEKQQPVSLASLLTPSKTVTVDYPTLAGFTVDLCYLAREELIKLYNSPCKEINYVSTDMLYESNTDLPKDKAFHGILLLGKL